MSIDGERNRRYYWGMEVVVTSLTVFLEIKTMLEQEQIDQLDTLRGTKGPHFDLAKQVKSLGFEVRMDSDDNTRSEIVLMGCWWPGGSDIVVGEIIGDAEAEIQ